MGLTGERKAFAAAVLAFYSFLFLILAFAPPPGWSPCFYAMAAVYGAGFFALVAGYFWARWYAMGLGLYGVISAAFSMWQAGAEPVLVFYGITHLIVAGFLWGKGMSAGFDGRAEWRERFHLDETSTHRLGKAVVRAGVSLPMVVIYALAPKDGAGMVLAIAGATAAIAGLWALTRMRTWGLFALASAAALLAVALPFTPAVVQFNDAYALDVTSVGVASVALLVLAVAPFAKPLGRYLVHGKA